MLRAWCDFAPSWAVQCPIHHGMMDRAPDGGLIRGLHRSHHQHASGGSLLEKRSQPFLFLLPGEILALAAPYGLAPQHRFALAEVVGMHLPYRADLPA